MELVTFKITVLDKRNPANVLETRKFSLPRGTLTLESMMEAYGSEVSGPEDARSFSSHIKPNRRF
jgi:hypothetical protein